jgi:hypothetical protein
MSLFEIVTTGGAYNARPMNLPNRLTMFGIDAPAAPVAGVKLDVLHDDFSLCIAR